MTLLEATKKLCAAHHFIASRAKGQNFLIDETVYDAMIAAAELKPSDVVLEVGPGLGFLTERLAARTQKVFSVELDDALTGIARRRLKEAGVNNVTIFNENILNLAGKWAEALKKENAPDWSVVANLPYTITSLFLRVFISGNKAGLMPRRLTLLLQKEVAERLVATPGQLSILGVSVQWYARTALIKQVPAQAFWPVPKVDSAIVVIDRDDRYPERLRELGLSEASLFRIVKIGFSARRKMIKSTLAAGLQLPQAKVVNRLRTAGIDPTARAQALSLEDWLRLLVEFRENML